VQALAGRIPASRADEVLEQVGLSGAARRKVGGFSLGMRQRLGLATALLGDPRVLILDEPANGLDPEGVRWLRDLLREQARQGKAVLMSSHILGEVAQTVDHVIVLDRGRLVTQASLDELTAGVQHVVRIRTPEPDELRAALLAVGGAAVIVDSGWLEVTGLTPERIGIIAAARSIPIFETSSQGPSLEDVFFQLTAEREVREVTSVIRGIQS
jgi:ABC-2 type transport system ATP-binding protein